MIDYWLDKYGIDIAAEEYYNGLRDDEFQLLLLNYRIAETALRHYMSMAEFEEEV